MYEVIDDQGQCQVFSPLLTQVPSFEEKKEETNKKGRVHQSLTCGLDYFREMFNVIILTSQQKKNSTSLIYVL